MLEKGHTLEQIAIERNLNLTTIVAHAEALLSQGMRLDFSYLKPSSQIHNALEKAKAKHGLDLLKPLKEELEKQGHDIPYDYLRLLRLYMLSQSLPLKGST